MKKILMAAVALLMTVAANAQKGEMSVGGSVNYASFLSTSHVGIGPKFRYNLTDKWRAEVAANYYFKKDDVTTYDLNLNFHYLIPVGDTFTFYPMVGYTYDTEKDDFDGEKYTGHASGLNLGVGLEMPVNDKLTIGIQGHYQVISLFNPFILSLGATWKL